MNIRCPQCQTTFRVDPARVPPTGVRARCSRCGNTFQVAAPGSQGTAGAAPSGGPPPQTRTPDRTPTAPAAPERPGASPGPAAPPAAGARPAPPGPRTAAPGPAGPGPGGGTPPPAGAERPLGDTTPPKPPVFGSRDPRARAQRIARALVSDIVAYHPERREACLKAGTLRSDFRDEIMKSWEEYVAQVGLDTAKSTPFFRDALNEILASGQKVF